MSAVAAAARAAPPRQWYRDPLGCLHATLGTVVLAAGGDPTSVLGLGFEFRYVPGDVRLEEFYYPCRFPGDPARSIAPHHALRSRWWRPTDEDGLSELAERLERGELPIAAVDNYHLPFRPAYRDVHAAHLVVVYGIDAERGEMLVSDAIPPAFHGPVAAGDFLRGWSSANPRCEEDDLFTGAPIGRRCLSVEVDGPFRPLDRVWAREALRANAHGFRDRRESAGWSGLAGLERFVDRLLGHACAADAHALEELYPLGWALQAQAYLHGELLRELGVAWRVPELREAGRAAASVAYAWTGLRCTGAHGRAAPIAAAADLRRHAGRLRRAYERAVEAVEQAVDALE
jgi:Butirosin biosynthesis protein H, N-terminal